MFQRLSMTTTSLHNVVISNDSDVIYYEVITPRWEPHLTKIRRMNPDTKSLDLVGELQNEGDRSVAVRVQGGAVRPTEDFLRTERDLGTRGRNIARFRGKDGKNYMWRTRKGRLELLQEGCSEGSPVAVYYQHRRYFFILKVSRQPYIDIDASVIETLDTVILSFLLVERKRRRGWE